MPYRVDVSVAGEPKGRRDRVLAAVLELAARQLSVVAAWQLLDAGITWREIRGLVSSSLLTRVFRGVYFVGPMPVTEQARFMAATLAVAPSLLADRSALEIAGLLNRVAGPVHIVGEGPARRPQPGLVTHRTRRLPAERRTKIDGIPVVVPMLALVQATPRLYPSEMREVLNRSEAREILDPRLVDQLLCERPKLKRRGRLLRMLEPYRNGAIPTRSILESRFSAEYRRRGLTPLPTSNVPLDRFEVDFFWRHSGLVVELDGFENHSSRETFERDRAKWSRITALGHPLIVVTSRRLDTDADALFAEIAAVNAR